jgi:hypothetical protein
MLEAADEVSTFNDTVAHRAIPDAQRRAAFIMQQVERHVLAMCRGMNADGNSH